LSCYCKRKGKNFEKLVAERIREAIKLGERDVAASRGGCTEPDIYLSEEAAKRYPYHTECKNQKTLRIPGWVKQSTNETPKGQTPTVVFKLHGSGQLYILLPFDEWLKIHEK
jgi:hypothetical protein